MGSSYETRLYRFRRKNQVKERSKELFVVAQFLFFFSSSLHLMSLLHVPMNPKLSCLRIIAKFVLFTGQCASVYEVCSENNGNFLISRVWIVLLSNFFFYYVGIHAPEV